MKLGLGLAALTGLQLTIGLASQIAVLKFVGAGAQTDAFVIAQTLPLLLVSVLATPMQSAWLPRLATARAEAPEWRRQQAVAHGQMLWLMAGTLVPLAVAAPHWLTWIFPGLDSALRPLAVEMTRLLLAGALLNAHSLLMATAMRANERFLLPEIVSAGVALCALMALFWTVPQFGVLGAAVTAFVRSAATALLLFHIAGRPRPDLRGAMRGDAPWRTLRPLLAGASLYKLSPLVDRYWGSMAASGGLTLLTLSQTGMSSLAQVMERALAMPVTARLAPLTRQGDGAVVSQAITRSVRRIAGLTAVTAAVMLSIRPWWSDALSALLHLAPSSSTQLWWICMLLVGFTFVSAAGGLPVAAFLALGDGRTPVLVSSVAFLIGVGLKSAGFLVAGVPGLALATSVYYLGNFLVVSHLLRKRLHGLCA